MINPTGYVISCDQTGCDRVEQHENRFMLMALASAEGWQRDVKLNGERAIRGGKDYCPGTAKACRDPGSPPAGRADSRHHPRPLPGRGLRSRGGRAVREPPVGRDVAAAARAAYPGRKPSRGGEPMTTTGQPVMPDMRAIVQDIVNARAHYADRYVDRRINHRNGDCSDAEIDKWTADAEAAWQKTYPALSALWLSQAQAGVSS